MIRKKQNLKNATFCLRNIAWGELLIIVLAGCLSIAYTAIDGSASVGIADIGKPDWTIDTPGGNAIATRPDGPDGIFLEGDSTVYVRDIIKWRFQSGYVVGIQYNHSTDKTYLTRWFIFHEPSCHVQFFTQEKLWQDMLKKLNLVEPYDDWMTGGGIDSDTIILIALCVLFGLCVLLVIMHRKLQTSI